MNIYFGENIRNMRKAKGLTQEEFANDIGVSFQTVSKWERGETYPDITMLPIIAGYFETTVDDLLGVDKSKREQEIAGYISMYDEMGIKDGASVLKKFEKAVIFGFVFSKSVQKLPGIGFLHLPEHRPVLLFPGDKRVFQTQPDQIFIFPGLFFLFQPSEETFQPVIVIVSAGKPDHSIPVDIGFSLGGIKTEIRQKCIICRGIPDLVVCPFFLEIRDFRRHGFLTFSRRCWYTI